MIKSTFCILEGIGEKLERRIWEKGILTWDDFIDADNVLHFSSNNKMFFNDSLTVYTDELNAGNAPFFADKIKRAEHWRLFEEFKDSTVCLDIETNGYQPDSGGYVTVVGLYDGRDYKYFLHGENLTPENINRELARYKCLVTFHGAIFDIPFLRRSLRGINFNIPHFDLCFGARRLGFQGGLKKLEESIGIKRPEEITGMNGYDAVKLWENAKKGNGNSLELLIEYNKADTVNLFEIAGILYSRLRQSTGIDGYLVCENA